MCKYSLSSTTSFLSWRLESTAQFFSPIQRVVSSCTTPDFGSQLSSCFLKLGVKVFRNRTKNSWQIYERLMISYHCVALTLLLDDSSHSRCLPSSIPGCPLDYSAPARSKRSPAWDLPTCRTSGSPCHPPPIAREKPKQKMSHQRPRHTQTHTQTHLTDRACLRSWKPDHSCSNPQSKLAQARVLSRRQYSLREANTHTDSKRYSQAHASCCSSSCTPTSPREEICYLLLITDWVIGRVKTAPTAYKRRPKPKPSQDPSFSSNFLSKCCLFERRDEFQMQECPMPLSRIISTGAPCNYLQPRPAWFGPCPPSPFPLQKQQTFKNAATNMIKRIAPCSNSSRGHHYNWILER